MQLQSEDLWQQYYKEVIHRIEDIVLVYDNNGTLVNWNCAAAQQLGYEGQELYGLDIHTFFIANLPFIKQEETKYYQEFYEVAVYRKNRTCFMSNIRILSVMDRTISGICIIHNIQQLWDLQNQVNVLTNELQHANEVKNLFLANMTHELRTPLNGMMGMLASIDTKELKEETKEDIQILQSCCKTMNRIVDQVLNYTKIAAGKLTPHLEHFMVRPWLSSIIRLNQRIAHNKGLNFETMLDERLPIALFGDSEWIGQVLNNLLNNAVKFTEQGSVRLEVVVKEDKENIVTILFVVSDTGIGIKKEQRKDLFQSFSQGDASITRKYGGTGLGLAISKGIVEALGGTLEVESCYQQGSRFYFELNIEKGNPNQIYKETENQHLIKNEQGNEKVKGYDNSLTVYNTMHVGNINDILNQIELCMEFGSWEKVEEYCHRIKCWAKEKSPEISKWAFRMELASRKRDVNRAKEHFIGLKTAVKGIKEDSCEEGE